MAGKHRTDFHSPLKCKVCTRHIKSLGTDLLAGLGVVLLPMILSDDFKWSVGWWGAAGGVVGRRAIVIVLMYFMKVLIPKARGSNEEEDVEDEPHAGDDSGNHQISGDDPVADHGSGGESSSPVVRGPSKRISGARRDDSGRTGVSG